MTKLPCESGTPGLSFDEFPQRLGLQALNQGLVAGHRVPWYNHHCASIIHHGHISMSFLLPLLPIPSALSSAVPCSSHTHFVSYLAHEPQVCQWQCGRGRGDRVCPRLHHHHPVRIITCLVPARVRSPVDVCGCQLMSLSSRPHHCLFSKEGEEDRCW